MVTDLKKVAITKLNGYSYITLSNGYYEDAIEFCPWDGIELQNAFVWELQHELYDIITQNEAHTIPLTAEIYCDQKDLNKMEGLLTNKFNIDSIPLKLRFLLSDKKWFDRRMIMYREMHSHDKFCGGFSAFLDSCYNEDVLPPITRISIKFCPFCGAELPCEFQTDEWWRKRGL